jgi:hypothetical protein
MFQFNKKLKRLDIPAKNVLRLQRSLGDVQIALPGITAQRATAYVCAFSTEHGLRVAIAFHLRDTNDVVYYLNGEGNIPRKDIGAVLQEGARFAETLGFILTDLDIHLVNPEAQKSLWESLPLKNKPEKVVPGKPITEEKSLKEQKPTEGVVSSQTLKVSEVAVVDMEQQKNSPVADIDLGLPRASALASVRRKKTPPTAEELEANRKRLRASLGRFLSSM